MEPGSSSTPGGTRGSPRTAAGFPIGDASGIEVVLADPAWRRFLPRAEALARRAAAAALAEGGAEGTMTVLLADDRELRRLNFQHRGKDKPTNVLSFPGGAPGHDTPAGFAAWGGRHLGDIALALGVVRREAEAAGRPLAAHFAHLVAHGTLHLLGHDHLTAGEARRMEQAEARVLARLRLPNPWKAVSGAAAAARRAA